MTNERAATADRLIADLDTLLNVAETLGQLRAEAAADQLTNAEIRESFHAIPEQATALQAMRNRFEQMLRELIGP